MLRPLQLRRGLLRAALLLLCIVISTGYLLLHSLYHQRTSPPTFLLDHPYLQSDLDALDPRPHDHGDDPQLCVLPRLHPFDSSIWRFLESPKQIHCAARRPELTTVENGVWLRFNETELKRNGLEVGHSLKCSWSEVKRDENSDHVDDDVTYGEEIPLGIQGVILPAHVEVLRVVCRNFANLAVYEYFHARIREIQMLSKSPKKPINVLIFGIDSMSRLAFIRHLPKTYQYLTDRLGMTVLRGMNKVGDNTYPNLVALLTGKECYGGHLPDATLSYDNWPLIWKQFREAGFVTLWAEDFPDFGLFNYLAPGFRKQPVDHYLRPFWLALKGSSLLRTSSHMCYGRTPRHLLQMNYVRDFVSSYHRKKAPYFGFSFLAEISHEYVSRVSSADVHFRDFFRWMEEEGYLDDTLLVVMSDHGHRFNSIRMTEVGHIEERMPFYAIRIPRSITKWQSEVLDNLLLNSRRLVTPFDVHATLVDLLEYILHERPLGKHPPPSGDLGLSLFGKVPSNRTCKGASIPVHYCACESVTQIEVTDKRAQLAALATIEQINQLLKDATTCSPLVLGKIKTASLVKMTEGKDGIDSEERIRVVLEAEPSKGLFESTVMFRESIPEVMGEVSRINPYAGQSDCIQHTILRKYCFCIIKRTARNARFSLGTPTNFLEDVYNF